MKTSALHLHGDQVSMTDDLTARQVYTCTHMKNTGARARQQPCAPSEETQMVKAQSEKICGLLPVKQKNPSQPQGIFARAVLCENSKRKEPAHVTGDHF